jgi:hypothetical protein
MDFEERQLVVSGSAALVASSSLPRAPAKVRSASLRSLSTPIKVWSGYVMDLLYLRVIERVLAVMIGGLSIYSATASSSSSQSRKTARARSSFLATSAFSSPASDPASSFPFRRGRGRGVAAAGPRVRSRHQGERHSGVDREDRRS